MKPGFHLHMLACLGSNHTSYLREHLKSAHAILRPPLRELSVALIGDAEIARLHEQFMGVRGPTDVLTFPIDQDGRGRAISGEVVICVPEARRQAKRRKTPIERELLLYALHGLLHLAGFDDRTPAGFAKMHRKEDEILTRLGVGPVFGSEGEAPAERRRLAGRLALPSRARPRNGER